MVVSSDIVAFMHASSSSRDPLADRLITALTPLLKGGQAEVMAATSEFDLTLSQLRMLFVLENAEQDLAVNELAERVSLSVAAAGRAIDGMVRAGLMSRREDDSDRRIKRIGLTDSGRQAIARISDARRLSTERFVARLSAAERAALEGALETISALAAEHMPVYPGPSCTTLSPEESAK
jgi:DNA-binding MarR family transcriptional regulator